MAKILIYYTAVIALLFYFCSFTTSLIGLGLIIIKSLWDLGIFRSIKFYKGKFGNSEIFYIKYTGEYKKIGVEFEKVCKIMDKFKLDGNLFSTFGIYYDNPETTDPKKGRAIVGLRREIFDDIKPTADAYKDLREYLASNNFSTGTLPDMICVRSSFPFNSFISMMIGISKFYKSLWKNMKDKEFLKIYDFKEANPKFTIEVYQNSEINFYVPLKENAKITKFLEEFEATQ